MKIAINTRVSPYVYPGLKGVKLTELSITRDMVIPAIVICCHCDNVELKDLVASRRQRPIVRLRHVICYILHEYTELTLLEIGEAMRPAQPMDHTTIIYACSEVRKFLDQRSIAADEYRSLFDKCCEQLIELRILKPMADDRRKNGNNNKLL